MTLNDSPEFMKILRWIASKHDPTFLKHDDLNRIRLAFQNKLTGRQHFFTLAAEFASHSYSDTLACKCAVCNTTRARRIHLYFTDEEGIQQGPIGSSCFRDLLGYRRANYEALTDKLAARTAEHNAAQREALRHAEGDARRFFRLLGLNDAYLSAAYLACFREGDPVRSLLSRLAHTLEPLSLRAFQLLREHQASEEKAEKTRRHQERTARLECKQAMRAERQRRKAIQSQQDQDRELAPGWPPVPQPPRPPLETDATLAEVAKPPDVTSREPSEPRDRYLLPWELARAHALHDELAVHVLAPFHIDDLLASAERQPLTLSEFHALQEALKAVDCLQQDRVQEGREKLRREQAEAQELAQAARAAEEAARRCRWDAADRRNGSARGGGTLSSRSHPSSDVPPFPVLQGDAYFERLAAWLRHRGYHRQAEILMHDPDGRLLLAALEQQSRVLGWKGISLNHVTRAATALDTLTKT